MSYGATSPAGMYDYYQAPNGLYYNVAQITGQSGGTRSSTNLGDYGKNASLIQQYVDADTQAAAGAKQTAATQAQTAATRAGAAQAQSNSDTAKRGASDQAYQQFLNTSSGALSTKGVDPNSFMGQILGYANSVRDSGSTSYSPTLVDSILQGEQTRRGNDYLNQFNSRTPNGFEKSLIPDTSLDPLIKSILDPQVSQAQTQLTNAKSRGMLDDMGYSQAETRLGSDQATAEGTVRGLGSGILDTYRRGLTDAAGSARNSISGYTLGGSAPDVGGLYGGITSQAQGDIGQLGGALSAATGGKTYIDPSAYFSVQGSGAQSQQSQGGASEVASALAARKQRDASGRGVGTTGAF